jgi:hypothetical protein
MNEKEGIMGRGGERGGAQTIRKERGKRMVKEGREGGWEDGGRGAHIAMELVDLEMSSTVCITLKRRKESS